MSGDTRFTRALATDLERLLPLVRALHEHEGIDWRPERVRALLAALIEQPAHGHPILIHAGDALAGYLLVGVCYSLEFGGRHGLLDELYLLPAFRGGGRARAAIEHAIRWCRAQRLAALRLELGDGNERAEALYAGLGFQIHPRRPMTRWLQD